MKTITAVPPIIPKRLSLHLKDAVRSVIEVLYINDITLLGGGGINQKMKNWI